MLTTGLVNLFVLEDFLAELFSSLWFSGGFGAILAFTLLLLLLRLRTDESALGVRGAGCSDGWRCGILEDTARYLARDDGSTLLDLAA